MKIPWDAPRRKWKEVARMKASDFSPRSSVVMLPGNIAREIFVAEERGMLVKNHTHLFLAERNQEYAQQLKEVLKSSGWDKCSTLHEGPLHTMKILRPIDYAHIDLNGTITSSIGAWMATEFSRRLTPGAVVCLTQEFCWRSNQWMKAFRKEVINNHLGAYNEFRSQHLLLGTNEIARYVTFPPFLVACLLRDWQLAVLEPYRYNDTIDMALFRFVVIDREPNPFFPNPFEEVSAMATSSEVIDALVKAHGLSPAHRANATRKLNAYVAEKVKEGKNPTQVAAAIKAHVTRRLAPLRPKPS